MKTLYERISPDFNDNSSHKVVMRAWDKAIKLAKEDKNENC